MKWNNRTFCRFVYLGLFDAEHCSVSNWPTGVGVEAEGISCNACLLCWLIVHFFVSIK
jgi:cytosine/uracil/thiamine/allantoin permease